MKYSDRTTNTDINALQFQIQSFDIMIKHYLHTIVSYVPSVPIYNCINVFTIVFIIIKIRHSNIILKWKGKEDNFGV